MSCAWKMLFVQRAGGTRGAGRGPGAREGGPAGWTRSRTRHWVPGASGLCRRNARWTVPGWEPQTGLGQPPGWWGVATELSQGVRSQAGGPGVGPELMAGDRGASRPGSHTCFPALVGDHGHPLHSDTTPASGAGDTSLWSDSPHFSPACFTSGASW